MKSSDWLNLARSEFTRGGNEFHVRDGDPALLARRLRKAARIRGLMWTVKKAGKKVKIIYKTPCNL